MADTQAAPLKAQAADAPRADLDRSPTDGMGLCFSGGGYRAMVYHIGALVRLNELGLLPQMTEFSFVSGASPLGGQLGLAWKQLDFDANGVATNLIEEVAKPVLALIKHTIDVRAVLQGQLVPGQSPANILAGEYDKHLFHGADIADLPTKPRFTFFATNMQTGRAWAFDAAQALDARVGVIEKPPGETFFPMATVAAASAALPPWLSPLLLDISGFTVKKLPWCDLHYPPFTTTAELADGGLYDNFGSERAMRHCKTILVSNAGAVMADAGSTLHNPISQGLRAAAILDQRAEDERLARLRDMDETGQRQLVYWSIHKATGDYDAAGAVPFTRQQTEMAGSIHTRLEAMSDPVIALLLKAGYAGADAGIRERGLMGAVPPGNYASLPLPESITGVRALQDELKPGGVVAKITPARS